MTRPAKEPDKQRPDGDGDGDGDGMYVVLGLAAVHHQSGWATATQSHIRNIAIA
jgi:hypothetical protein